MVREQAVEDQVVHNLDWFGYAGALWIRRPLLGREGFGAVDLLLLPSDGPHRVVLVEVKHSDSRDAPGRLVGQLLAYYLACLRLGSDGLDCLRRFASGAHAHDTRRKSLQMLSGLGRGSKHADLRLLRTGQRLAPHEIALLIVVGTDEASTEARESLADLRAWLWLNGALDVPMAIARSDGGFEWAAQRNRPLQPTSGGNANRRFR